MTKRSDIKTLTYESFSAGIDLREGSSSRDSRKFLDLENYITTYGRKLIRRPPWFQHNGILDANSVGLGYLNGEFIAIAKSGTTVTHSIVGVTVRTIYFDNPEYATTWEVLDFATLNEVIVVVIRHGYPGGDVESLIRVHVFDDKRPTWVDDPACPTSWTKELPQQPYGKGTKGEWKDYTPSFAVVADKLHVVRPDGNTQFSAVNRPRVYADRDANDILDNGRMFYFVIPVHAGNTVTFTVPIQYGQLSAAQKYAAYVLEYIQDNGTWTQFTEVSASPTANQFTLTSVTSRYDPTDTESRITLYSSDTGRIIRFRALARPALNIIAGCAFLHTGYVTGGTVEIEGASYAVENVNLPTLTADTFYHIVVVAPGAPISLVNYYAGTAGTMPLNGQQRYWTRILAVAETDGTGNAFDYEMSGTVTVITGDSKVVGSSTDFLDEVTPGESILINGQTRIIESVSSDTVLHVSEVWTTSASGVVARHDVRYLYGHEVGDAGNTWFADRETEAAFTLAGADNAGSLNTSLYDPSGQVPICLGAAQNRLLVQSPESVQLWGVQADPNLNAYLGSESIGAGVNTAPTAALVDGFIAIPTHVGPMLFAPDGSNKDYIRKVRIGDLVEPLLKTVNFTNAVWWPRMRLFVTCESANEDGVTLWSFAFHPDDKTTSWSRTTIAGLTRVDRLFVAQDKLYLLSDRRLWSSDPAATSFIDSSDDEDEPYTSTARWLYNDFGAPSFNKKLTTFDIDQTGKSTVSFFTSPFSTTSETSGPSVTGETKGRQRLAVAVLTPGLSLEITSQDPTGHQLNSVGFTYALMRR